MYSCTSLERYDRTYGTQYDITPTSTRTHNGKANAIAHLFFRNKNSKNSKNSKDLEF